MTALGDSVPYGTACNCTPYPQLSGTDIEQVAAHPVEVSNDAVPGARSQDVVDQFQHAPDVMAHVEGSQAVLVEVGANDVAYSSNCATTVSCYDTMVPDLEHNLTTIVKEIRELTHGHEVAVVLLDYWSVWLGGQYAHAQGPDYTTAADTVTAHVNETIRSVANSTDSISVSISVARSKVPTTPGTRHTSWQPTEIIPTPKATNASPTPSRTPSRTGEGSAYANPWRDRSKPSQLQRAE